MRHRNRTDLKPEAARVSLKPGARPGVWPGCPARVPGRVPARPGCPARVSLHWAELDAANLQKLVFCCVCSHILQHSKINCFLNSLLHIVLFYCRVQTPLRRRGRFFFSSSGQWLGVGTVDCRTHDQAVVGLTRSRVVIEWLLLGWLTVYGQMNNIGIWLTTHVNLAFHPSGVGKWSTGLRWVGLSQGAFTCSE